jgi:hypothetical protein
MPAALVEADHTQLRSDTNRRVQKTPSILAARPSGEIQNGDDESNTTIARRDDFDLVRPVGACHLVRLAIFIAELGSTVSLCRAENNRQRAFLGRRRHAAFTQDEVGAAPVGSSPGHAV